jgi:hypothetical protein
MDHGRHSGDDHAGPAGATPDRETTPEPSGAGDDQVRARTGAEQPWDPEDLAAARGQDPTPDAVEHSRRDLAEQGPAAVEKTVP